MTVKSVRIHHLEIAILAVDDDYEVAVDAPQDGIWRTVRYSRQEAEVQFEKIVKMLETAIPLTEQQLHQLGLNKDDAFWQFGRRHWVRLNRFPPEEQVMMKLKYG